MEKIVECRKEFDRSSNIELVKRNNLISVENDIEVSLRLDKNQPRVNVRYGDELPLNQPSVRLEDVPTSYSTADSELGDYMENIETSLAQAQKEISSKDEF